MSTEISPPPSKRRRLTQSQPARAPSKRECVTVYSQNVNGIAPFLQQSITSFFQPKRKAGDDSNGELAHSSPGASLRDFLRRHDWPTLLFLQEVKINPGDGATIKALEKAVRSSAVADEPDYVAHLCLPSDKYNARGFGRKVYGVCSIVHKEFYEDYVEKVRPVDWDCEGRFLVIETKAIGDGPRLAIINVYAVNGTDMPYKDPETGAVAGTRHERKMQVHKLLQAECRRLEAEGFGVITAGDMNVARSSIDGFPKLRTFPLQHCVNRADFEARFFGDRFPQIASHQRHSEVRSGDEEKANAGGLGMVDTFRYLHPEKRGFSYYPRGRTFGESCDRVDMVIISSSLKQYLLEAGLHETPAERGPSDHVPLYAVLDFSVAENENKKTDDE